MLTKFWLENQKARHPLRELEKYDVKMHTGSAWLMKGSSGELL
jgi:hypothetical protein